MMNEVCTGSYSSTLSQVLFAETLLSAVPNIKTKPRERDAHKNAWEENNKKCTRDSRLHICAFISAVYIHSY